MSQSIYREISGSFFKRKEVRYGVGILIMLALPLVYALVYATGGITYVYSHTMYIPILLAGIFFGPKFGLAIGIIAGILLGPIMPLSVADGTNQELSNWLYRFFIFALMGLISGYASDELRKSAVKIDALSSIDPETLIPNTNFLKHMNKVMLEKEVSLITILVNNIDSITDILGVDVYHQLLKDLHLDFTHQSREMLMIQPDSNKLWLIIAKTDIESDLNYIMQILNKSRTVHQIPLYVDYAVGITSTICVEQHIDIQAFSECDIAARHAQINNLPTFIFDDGKLKKRSDYELVSNFTKALEQNQTFLVYQPIMDLKTNKVRSIEALIRWEHPTKGLIMPDRFIPLVEETKLIHLLTDWVVEKSLLMLKKMSDQGLDTGISINVSAKNLYDPLFFERTMTIIKKHKVDISKLEIEITETELMINPTEAKEVLNQFAKQGLKVALDDFGSGYSSLAYLTQFPLDVIKIDKIFMIDILTRPQIKQIVSATVALSRELGYNVVAEGIEDKETSDYLTSIGCDYAQGYYYAKPMRELDILKFINQ